MNGTTASANTPSGLTLAMLQEQMRTLRDAMSAAGPAAEGARRRLEAVPFYSTLVGSFGYQLPPPYGVRIVESALCLETTTDPLRVHRRRRGQSASYHRRVQKKWTRRWGFVQRPCMFKVSPGAIGLDGDDYFLAHPSLSRKIRDDLRDRQVEYERRTGGIVFTGLGV